MYMIAIRDDDTSYWTKLVEIRQVYGKYLDMGYKISLAVVPFSYCIFYRGDRKKMYIGEKPMYIYENREIVNFLSKYN